MITIPKIFKHTDADGSGASLPLLPLRDIVVFPYMVSPLFVGRTKSINALSEAMNTEDKYIFLATQANPGEDHPKQKDINRTGTIAKVLQMLRLPDGTVKTVVEGKHRARIVDFETNESFFKVSLEILAEPEIDESENEAYIRNVVDAFQAYTEQNKNISKDTIDNISNITDPVQLLYTTAAQFSFKARDNQQLLETHSLTERLTYLIELINQETTILKTDQKIKNRIKKQMEQSQKNYYLNEQIRAIKKEMGEDESEDDELKELEERIENKEMSEEAEEKVKHEFNKLKKMTPMSAEATVTRNYIDWILSLPWFEKSEISEDLDASEKILDEDHYGLERPKERILEYLAVQSLVQKIRGPILCLVGPPGVGKTSVAKSVARATGREFVRQSLGGVRDEAEIRGHRRTYIGAMPGKIIQSLRKAGVNNPVFCLDEVDKMSMDFRGDPSAALLEVLDPEQNYAFNDHYLDMDYDLSDILFITTANTLPDIPAPLQDRMEIIRLPGYTEHEKYNIANLFLVPKQIRLNGLDVEKVRFSKNALYTVIRNYTREAGVRNLEREIASICRKIARSIAKSGQDKVIHVNSRSVEKYLGPIQYRRSQLEEKDLIGIVTGLAWTQFGGELLHVESAIMPGKGEYSVTGKLGDVMKESARAAISYVRSRSDQFNIDPQFYEKFDIHVHVPEGATPKDGPSAGIAMCTSILSTLAKLPVRKDMAMTGEITLRGRVLPVGGLKEKILAAHRARIHKVIIPAENEKDLKEIPASILKQLEIIPVEHMDQVIDRAIVVAEGSSLYKPADGGEQTFNGLPPHDSGKNKETDRPAIADL
ncbi:MAG: endopeptidase La [Desulfobacterales bacterium]|nr:endopeptidase La [Desulfobacterales bacterium]MBS3755668.1 endopeptidase La [Desulfobacterales bacterium]